MDKISGQKEVKKWGGSLILKFSPDDIRLLKLQHKDFVNYEISIVKHDDENFEKESNKTQEHSSEEDENLDEEDKELENDN